MEIFEEMLDDYSLREKDYFDVFIKMCDKYNEHSYEPYDLFCEVFQEEIPFETYYLEALMYIYSMYEVDDTFLDTLQAVVKTGYCKEYIEKTHERLKEYIQDGYILAYRGEFATKTKGNLDYTESVSYSLDYDQAKFFATRFKMLPLTKSVVYTVKVPIEDVVAFIDREDEVVCVPISIGGKMEIIKEESFL